MIDFDTMGDWLDEIAERFPEEFFRELTGGIALLPRAESDPEFPEGEVYILGDYCNDELGRYINLYYGSFAELFADAGEEELYEELYATLAHEFTHHLESLAGERGLEVKDELELEWLREEFGEQQGPADGG